MKVPFIIISFLFIFLVPGYSQYLTSKDSDPEALKLLTSAGKAYTGKNVQINFKIKMSYPASQPELSEGLLYQNGKSYRLELKDYIIISNGTTRWVYLKGPNEVNIYNESNGQDWISPQDFLQLYTSNDLVFVLASKRADGTSVIEAKPLKGRFSEYSKFTIGLKNGTLSYVNGLSTDGMRQEMTITSMTNPTSWDANKLFTFHPESFPGATIEDLRLD
jgi:outer membrane lipoprotein-sorting protein